MLDIIVEEYENICYCMSSYEAFCKRRCSKIMKELQKNGIICKRKNCKETYDPREQLDNIIEIAQEICKERSKARHKIMPSDVCDALRILVTHRHRHKAMLS